MGRLQGVAVEIDRRVFVAPVDALVDRLDQIAAPADPRAGRFRAAGRFLRAADRRARTRWRAPACRPASARGPSRERSPRRRPCRRSARWTTAGYAMSNVPSGKASCRPSIFMNVEVIAPVGKRGVVVRPIEDVRIALAALARPATPLRTCRSRRPASRDWPASRAPSRGRRRC